MVKYSPEKNDENTLFKVSKILKIFRTSCSVKPSIYKRLYGKDVLFKNSDPFTNFLIPFVLYHNNISKKTKTKINLEYYPSDKKILSKTLEELLKKSFPDKKEIKMSEDPYDNWIEIDYNNTSFKRDV